MSYRKDKYMELITSEDIKKVLKDAVRRLVEACHPKHGAALHVAILIFAIATLLAVHTAFGGISSPIVESDTLDRMKQNQIKLYNALYRFALPDTDYSSKVQQRFILQVPGRVLNLMDYYPGKEYEEFLNSPKYNQQVVDIPQQVMERMFYLVDVVPGPHPLVGEETKHSLARLYESILDNIDQIGYDDMSEDGKCRFNEALEKLIESMPDPEDSSKQTSLFEVYVKFQKAYHNEELRMDRTISEKKKELKANDYQFWFERNYPILDAQVQAAYRRWLLYGQRYLAESYIARLAVGSSGRMLETARIALRLYGFMSQEHFQTAYPVTFSPSNWFKFLNTSNRDIQLTKDQLQAKIRDLQSRIALLETMSEKSTQRVEEAMTNSVNKERNKKQESLWQKTQELEDTRRKCWFIDSKVCNFWSKEEEVTDELSESTAANFKFEMLEWQFGDNSSLKTQIELVLTKLRNKTEQLQEHLMNYSVPSSVSPFINEVGHTEEHLFGEPQNQWQYFEFSSTRDEGDPSQASVSIGNIFPFNFKPAFQGYQTFSEQVMGANVTLKAKTLKVTINRPWLKHSLFHNRELKLRNSDKPVSPGYMKESDFYTEVTKENKDGPLYQLYQYPTAFLLAKDITMDFTGLSDEAKQTALRLSFGDTVQGNYGPIRFGGSISASGSYNYMQVSSTINGLHVYIPGTQLIGYYCDVVPKFPNTYNSTEFS